VSDPKLDLSRLGDLAAGPGLYQQLSLIYETHEQQFAVARPYLRAGLEGRERCIYIKTNRAAVLDALRKTGTDAGSSEIARRHLVVDRNLRSGALILTGEREIYFKPGHFGPDSNQVGESA
jgi:hypothetical protein